MEAPQRTGFTGYVYAAISNDKSVVKIGCTGVDPKLRLSGLRQDFRMLFGKKGMRFLAVWPSPDHVSEEMLLLARFRRWRIRPRYAPRAREWHSAAPEILAYIESRGDESLPLSAMIAKRRGAWRRAKTHCPAGHPYAGANLWISKSGKRHCLECTKRRNIERRELALKSRLDQIVARHPRFAGMRASGGAPLQDSQVV